MRPEDVNKFFEEAFEKIVPRDEAHRDKLEKMRERIRESNEQMAQEIGKVQEQMQSFDGPDRDAMRASASERERIAKEAVTAMTTGFQEQADLIERIAAATNRG